jgi:hypothetical protein
VLVCVGLGRFGLVWVSLDLFWDGLGWVGLGKSMLVYVRLG